MQVYDYSSDYSPAMPVCSIFIGPGGGNATLGPLQALIDTGADGMVVPTHYLHQINAQSVGWGKAHSIWGDSRIVSIFAISLHIGNFHASALRVMEDAHGDEIVIGRIVLNRMKIMLDGPAAMMDILAAT